MSDKRKNISDAIAMIIVFIIIALAIIAKIKFIPNASNTAVTVSQGSDTNLVEWIELPEDENGKSN